MTGFLAKHNVAKPFGVHQERRCAGKPVRAVNGQLQQGRPSRTGNQLLFSLVGFLFSIEPVWKAAKAKARQKIADRGPSIGVDQASEVAKLKAAVPDWDEILSDTKDSSVTYPEYYTKPFHAYDDGNLSWEAAFQVPSAAKLVHAPVMDPSGKMLRADGDSQMRRSYSDHMLAQLGEAADSVKQVVDLGCATGLSSLELQRIFPNASVTGIDLSPYFLAVGKVLQSQTSTGACKVKFLHGKAEKTGLSAASADLVSICLVLHELPQSATLQIVEEAYRVLKPGGHLAIMEMNPESQRFQRMFGNPFAFVPFKATEPWLEEYIGLDLETFTQNVGFENLAKKPSSPGHFTFVARKPC